MEQLRSEISVEDKALIDDSFALSNRIAYLLKKHKISQKNLAQKLQKRESEISKWLSGGHNFTQQTLTKISLAIGEPIYQIPGAEVQIEKAIDSIHIFKAIISKLVELKKISHTHFENYSEKEVSSLCVGASGVICKSATEQEKANFSPANLHKSDFKNIEKAIS
ncbi:XRE family transcriptional regulator [Pedobacter jejuensis]|uniref:XRE family transcriptional regulator n=2 Tax=Pedobacter jejuensis TaxID=1268550 RepID=A0A3N0BYC6_9SPHI|nr:XRE family transcriptional regulator [Pedobacter jejuensis]